MTTNAKHTPGPWVANFLFVGTAEDDPQTIAYASNDRNQKHRQLEEDKANARLIAAAPEQYDALCSAPVLSKYHTATGFDLEGFVRDYENWSEKKRAAIAKATGETP